MQRKLNTDFTEVYYNVLKHVKDEGQWQDNARTGTKVLATFGYSFRWDMNFMPLSSGRKMHLTTMAAEVAWMLSGSTSIQWLKKYTKIWNAFADDKDEIPTAYGHRWRHSFGVDQIQNIIDKLTEDPSSRQQVLMSWDARCDNVVPAANIPCPFTAVIAIINGKLNIHLTLRSNDVFYGLPYDVGMYTFLGQAFASELGVEVGELFYSIAHAHIYENQMDAVEEMLTDKVTQGPQYKVELRASITDIISDKSVFVRHVADIYEQLKYEPVVLANKLPKVVE